MSGKVRVEYESGAVLTGPTVETENGGLAVRLTEGCSVIVVRDGSGTPMYGVRSITDLHE